jgi:hypothetical protein
MMANAYNPDPPKPDARKLVRSTAIAAVVASVLLVTVVLPAEYGIDPTRIGRVLGLTQMGEIKVRLAREAAADQAADDAAAEAEAKGDTTSPTPPNTTRR